MRRYGNRRLFLVLKRAVIVPVVLIFLRPPRNFSSFFPMSRPCALELSASGSARLLVKHSPHSQAELSSSRKHLRSPRVARNSSVGRGTWNQQQYLLKLIHPKITHGTNRSKVLVQALRRRLLRRGLNSPRLRRTFAVQPNIWNAEQTEDGTGTLPIIVPRPPLLSLPCLYPETDSGYCSDNSRSPSPVPEIETSSTRPTRRYIRPDLSDPLAGWPSDSISTSEFRVRLSARNTTPRLSPVSFESFDLS
ncbi:hypothetical protein C8R46DRAFT_1077697 [Mycena filopes]|nr:hypothetical protein C8R46DRAFT_1077697 [Mycena filopes]